MTLSIQQRDNGYYVIHDSADDNIHGSWRSYAQAQAVMVNMARSRGSVTQSTMLTGIRLDPGDVIRIEGEEREYRVIESTEQHVTVEPMPLTVLPQPPATVASSPLAVLSTPPPMVLQNPLAVLVKTILL